MHREPPLVVPKQLSSTTYIHRETKTLKIRVDMDLKGAQFHDRIETDTSHPLHQPTETSETPHPHTTRAS